MLQNAYLLAKIGADTAENERKFVKLPYGSTTGARGGRAAGLRARVSAGLPGLPPLRQQVLLSVVLL